LNRLLVTPHITWPINTGCTIPGGTTGVLGVVVMSCHSEHRWSRVGAVYASDIWRLEDAAMGCLRRCRRLRRAPARHTGGPRYLIGCRSHGVTPETCLGSGTMVIWRAWLSNATPRHSIMGGAVMIGRSGPYRKSASVTVTMKHCGFSRKSVCSLTHDTTPATLTFSPWAL
jgi:hypothetical protein